MSGRLVDTTSPSAHADAKTLFESATSDRVAVIASGFRVHLGGMYFAEVGAEWDSGGNAESHYFHCIDIALSGRRQVVWQGRVIDVEPGTVYFWAGHTPMERRCREACEVLYMRFRCEMLPGVDPLLDWPQRQPARIGPCEVSHWRQWVTRQAPLGAQQILELQAQIQLWLTRLPIDLDGILGDHIESHAPFAPAFRLVETQLGANLRVEDLARECGISSDAFARAFARKTGITPKEFLQRRINREAIQCLVSTDLRINEIAHNLRFTDEFHFSRFFRKMNGMPPSQYRLHMQRGQIF